MTNFTEHAKGLTKNPLGIIGLFVSLIYGFACQLQNENMKLNGNSTILKMDK